MGSIKINRLISFAIIVQVLVFLCFGCSENHYLQKRNNLIEELHTPANVDKEMYVTYARMFANPFNIYTCQNDEVISIFRNFAGEVKPVVIANWDINGDGLKDYFIVDMIDREKRIIKKGMIIDEAKNIILIFDPNLGTYDSNITYYRTDKYYTGSIVTAFRIGFYDDEQGNSGLEYAFGRSKKFLETHSSGDKTIIFRIGLIPIDSNNNYVEVYIDSITGRYHIPYNFTMILQNNHYFISVGPILFGIEQYRQYHEKMHNNYLVLSSQNLFASIPAFTNSDRNVINQIIEAEKHIELYTRIYDKYNLYDQRIP